MRKCLAGPFIGEFGWELFCWQGFLRKRRPNYDSMTVICRTGHRAIYEDFADEIIEIEIPSDSINMWRNDSFDPEPVVSYYKKNGFTEFIPFDRYTTRWWLEKDAQLKQKFIPFGINSAALKRDILMHIRKAYHYGTAYRNWNHSHANQYAVWALDQGYSVACIGRSDTASHVPDTEDIRDIQLEDIVDIVASSRVLIGSQSGPHHLALLCQLPVIAWQERIDTAERLSSYWNPFNVRTWTKVATRKQFKEKKPFTPTLDWMKNCTLAALDSE